jgi:hypothetical protein
MGSEPAARKGKPGPKLTQEQRDALTGSRGLIEQSIAELKGQPVLPAQVDENHVFMLFASFSGDIFKTGAAAGLDPEEITRMAEAGKWMTRIRGLLDLKQFDKSGEIERCISRAMNFVQVNFYRRMIDRLVKKLARMTDDEMLEYVSGKTYFDNGQLKTCTPSAKVFADIATAMEKVHWMSYQSLVDAPQDRAGRREKVKDEGLGEDDVHARIAKALMTAPACSPTLQLEASLHEQVTGEPAVLPKPDPAN